MNIIEMILYIFNRRMTRVEAARWLDGVWGSAEIRRAILECMNHSGKFIHSDDEETPMFPLEYIFTRDGNIETQPTYEATIESILTSGTPIDPDTGDELEWTGQVVDMLPIPEDDGR